MATPWEQLTGGQGLGGGWQTQRTPTGVFGKVFDWLNRPVETLGEAVGAYRHDEDVFGAIWQGLRGRSKYGTIGEQIFEEAVAEPGMQAGDWGALAVDAVLDPVNILGVGLAKPVGKITAKGILGLAEKTAPKWIKILPEFEAGLTGAANRNALRKEIKLMQKSWRDAMGKAAYVDTKQLMRRVAERPSASKEVKDLINNYLTTSPKGGFRSVLKEAPDWVTDEIRTQLRLTDANWAPKYESAIASVAHQIAQKALPVAVTADRWGGPAGKTFASKLKNAYSAWRLDTEKYAEPIMKILMPLSREQREMSVTLRELATKADDTGISFDDLTKAYDALTKPEAAASRGWGNILDEVFDELAGWTDDLGNPLKVRTEEGKLVPFAEAFQKGYYPHRWPAGTFTREGRDAFSKMMLKKGYTSRKIESILNHIGKKPKRVGNIELSRIKGAEGYIMDPAVVLPKYISDVMFRKNMAQQFGVNNEILHTLLQDMKRAGMNPQWITQVENLITGKNAHDKLWSTLAKWGGSYQAFTKLGYATTVANLGQGPLNSITRTGLWNTAKGLVAAGRGELPELGAAAFSRASRADIMRGIMGAESESRLMDKFMDVIGFNWSERVGRHLGAVASEQEIASLGKRYMEAAAGGNSKLMSRLAWQMKHKYNLDPAMINHAGQFPVDAWRNAAVQGADVIMHSFFPGDLPAGWRTPFWNMVLQFKSFIYKQSEFMVDEVFAPGLKYLATDGHKGDIMPMLRTLAVFPVGGEVITHARDFVKSVPTHVYSAATKGEFGDWDYKKPFWDDPDPAMRVFSDLAYIGTLGILGDAIDAAQEGRMWKFAVGPTLSDVFEGAESLLGGSTPFGQFATRQLPGPLGIPYGANIPEEIQKMLTRR